MRILFVENHEVFAAIVEKEFLFDFDVVRTGTVKDSWDLFLKNEFDLCLVDYDLDDGKGSELIQRIVSCGRKTKIIGISSHERGNQELLKSGAGEICSKMQFSRIRKVVETI